MSVEEAESDPGKSGGRAAGLQTKNSDEIELLEVGERREGSPEVRFDESEDCRGLAAGGDLGIWGLLEGPNGR